MAIDLNPSSLLEYDDQQKYAALHGAQRYDDATDALQNDTTDAFKMILPEHALN